MLSTQVDCVARVYRTISLIHLLIVLFLRKLRENVVFVTFEGTDGS